MTFHYTRDISDKAYQAIKENGLLGKASSAIYETLFHHGPLTAGEVFEQAANQEDGHPVVKGAVCGRLTEMRRQGCVRIVCKRTCRVTGRTAAVWDITGRLPEGNGRQVESRTARIERLERDRAFLEDENRRLKEENRRMAYNVQVKQLDWTANVIVREERDATSEQCKASR